MRPSRPRPIPVRTPTRPQRAFRSSRLTIHFLCRYDYGDFGGVSPEDAMGGDDDGYDYAIMVGRRSKMR